MKLSLKFDSNKFKRLSRQIADKRLKNYAKRSREIIKDSMRYQVNTILPELIANYSPTYQEETELLTIGIDKKTGKTMGSSDGGRFIKNPDHLYVRDAIRNNLRFSMEDYGDDYKFDIKFEAPEDIISGINNSIGFGWLKKTGKNSLVRRDTRDSGAWSGWGDLLYIWEYGGMLNVTPRDKNRGAVLHPGPNKTTVSKEMTKSIKPFRMFLKGMLKGRKAINNAVIESLKNRLK
jgi:hypothetical protein